METGMDWASLRTVLDTEAAVAVYVTTPGCGPCASVRPRVRAVFGDDARWRLVEVNAVQSPDVSGQLTVFSVPALVLFVSGREVWRAARFLREDALRQAVDLAERAHPGGAER